MGRLQTGRLENFVRRWGSIKGGGSILSETLGDVFPVLDLENLTPENQLVASWHLFQGVASVTGGVAQLAGIQCVNPVDSGAILVVDAMNLHTFTGQTVGYGVAQAPFTPAITMANRDTRTGTVFTGLARIHSSTNVAGALGDVLVVLATGVDREIVIPNGIAVLAPGDALTIVAGTVNTLIRVNFFGRVRIAEPSELSF